MPKKRSVLYVDFKYSTAREVWEEVGLPAYQRFAVAPSRSTAMEAAIHAWHIHEWVWHEAHPDTNTQGNMSYHTFRANLITDCPELAWVQDIADATKHRGLVRTFKVKRINPAVEGSPVTFDGQPATFNDACVTFGGSDFTLELNDGSRHAVADVLARVVAFWQERFEKASPRSRAQPL